VFLSACQQEIGRKRISDSDQSARMNEGTTMERVKVICGRCYDGDNTYTCTSSVQSSETGATVDCNSPDECISDCGGTVVII